MTAKEPEHIVYQVVQHDGGWAYKVGDVFSETFPDHDGARQAAERAAAEHRLRGSGLDIEYQDRDGDWRTEHAGGDDRPDTEVEG